MIGISKSFFSEWNNNIKNKINNRIEVLNNTLHKYKQFDALSSPDITGTAERNFVWGGYSPFLKSLLCAKLKSTIYDKIIGGGYSPLSPPAPRSVYKATGNIALICKRFYASVIAKELGLGNNTTDTYNSINNSSTDTIIKRVKLLKE